MTEFNSYKDVSDKILDEKHTASTGEKYTLRHNEILKVDMRYVGQGKSNANAQGWERNNTKYFKELYNNHPEVFSKKNIARIESDQAPVVDKKMIEAVSEWKEYKNQPLIHHHIGGDGEAVAVPCNEHKGQGEIHNYEKAAGITDKCKDFSDKCESYPESVGKTSSELHHHFDEKQSDKQKSAQKGPGSEKSTETRADVVRKSVRSETPKISRKEAVKSTADKAQKNNSVSRSEIVRNSVNNTGSSSGQSSHKETAHHQGSGQKK